MGVFVGREREIRLLDEQLAQTFVTDGKLVLLSGEPGIGKTRLGEELSRHAEHRGFLVAWGRSWEGKGTPAYFPWLQALRRLLPSQRPLFDAARADYPELGTLLDAGRGAHAQQDDECDRHNAPDRDPTESRFRMFDAIAELLRRVSEEKPILIVLDDLHAADISTLHLLHFVARNLRRDSGARLLLVGTLRDAAFQAGEDVTRLLAQIAREATVFPLARLGRDALATWIGDSAPDLSANVDRVLSISEGNPLFVGELLAAAKKRPTNAWSSAHEMPLGIREAIRAHVALLSEPAQEMLAIASVLGRDFSMAALTRLAAGDERGAHDIETICEEAIGIGLLFAEVGADERHRLRFTHVLMRDELYAALPPQKRSELHRAAAEQEPDPVLSSSHWIACSAHREDASRVASIVRDAVRDANARFAFEDAAALAERALDAIAFAPREAGELHIAAGDAWVLAGKINAARIAGAAAAELARKLGDATLLARAALVHATEFSVGDRDETSVHLLRSALEALGPDDSRLRAQVMGRLSIALLPAPVHEHDEALRIREESIAMARRLGDEETLFAVLCYTRTTPTETGDARDRFRVNAETIALAKKLGRVPLIAPVLSWQVATCIELGDIDGAARAADEMESLLSAYKQPSYTFRVPLVRAMLADIEGRFAEADALSREALRISQEHGIFPATLLFATQRGGFMYTRGDDDGFEEFEPMILRFLNQGPLFALFRCIFDAMRPGRVEMVRESLAMTKNIPLHALPDGAGLGGPCAAAGIREHAQRFYDLVAKQERMGAWQFGPGRVTSMGPRAFTLGRLALLLDREEDALEHFASARALVQRLRSRPFLAQIDLAIAEVLAKPGRLDRDGGDRRLARERAESALAIAKEIGMRVVGERATALLEVLDASGAGDARDARDARDAGDARDGSALPSPVASSSPPVVERPPQATPTLMLERVGEMWRLGTGDDEHFILLKDTKGLSYLDALVRSPCREVHVLELVGLRDDGDAGPMLDEHAKRAYRERAASLREELEEATRNSDLGRASSAQTELDALARELSRAFGLGGRDRRAASPTERARINVQRRIRDVIGRARAEDARIGEHLGLSVRTGVFCVYLPAWPTK